MSDRDVPAHVQRFISQYAIRNQTIAEWAKEFDVSDATISNWIHDYKDEINTLLNEVRNGIRDELVKLGREAVLTVNELMRSESENIRLGAVKTVFENVIPKRTESAVEMTGKEVKIEINSIGGT